MEKTLLEKLNDGNVYGYKAGTIKKHFFPVLYIGSDDSIVFHFHGLHGTTENNDHGLTLILDTVFYKSPAEFQETFETL